MLIEIFQEFTVSPRFVGVFGFFIRHRLLKSEYENHKKFKNEKAKHSRIDTI